MSKRSLSLTLTALVLTALTTALVTGCNGRQFERAISAGATKTSTAFAKVDGGVRSSATKTSTAFARSDDGIRSTAISTSRAFSDLDSGKPRWMPPSEHRQTDRCSSRGTIVIYRERHAEPVSTEPAALVVGPAPHETPVPPLLIFHI